MEGTRWGLNERERLIVVETTQAMHESRLTKLERFQYFILTSALVGACGSCGTLIMYILESQKGH